MPLKQMPRMTERQKPLVVELCRSAQRLRRHPDSRRHANEFLCARDHLCGTRGGWRVVRELFDSEA